MAAFAEGTPCWVDAQLPDLEAGKRFYGELFGWTFGEDPGAAYGHYTTAFKDGRRVAALAPKRDGRLPTTWGVYLATPDATALAARIEAAGGSMVMTPFPIGPFGVMALAADPGGAVFGLWQPGSHPGFELQNTPGSFCWAEVYTRHKEAVDAFYTSVFGYETRDIDAASEGDSEPIDFRVWSPKGSKAADDTAIGGRSVINDAFPAEMPSHFLVYFAVEDCDATALAATRLGGRVTEPPFDTPYGRIAALIDNQGAAFAVLAEPEPLDQGGKGE
ncbi:VOC family protein [Streptomyces purpureus]|uniref:VOC family protein n=1 Tax=Streptomyces purpureus TaxID=1951 RepID=UPI0037A8FCE1